MIRLAVIYINVRSIKTAAALISCGAFVPLAVK